MKFVSLNGELVPSETAAFSVFDRGFLYGDALFETLRVAKGRPMFWEEHWSRLNRGADYLRIGLPYEASALRRHADKLLEANDSPDAVLRIHLSRGAGPRGYSPRDAKSPTLVMSTHPLPATPESWNLATSSFQLPAFNPLSAFKTTNKLLQVAAKTEAEEKGAQEGLLLTDSGEAAQGASSNLFWIEGQTIFTPPEQSGILPGVTRAAVLRVCDRLNLPVQQATAPVAALQGAAGVFMTLSTHGVIEVRKVDGRELNRSAVTHQIREALHILALA